MTLFDELTPEEAKIELLRLARALRKYWREKDGRDLTRAVGRMQDSIDTLAGQNEAYLEDLAQHRRASEGAHRILDGWGVPSKPERRDNETRIEARLRRVQRRDDP
jgi:hypothetical protein